MEILIALAVFAVVYVVGIVAFDLLLEKFNL